MPGRAGDASSPARVWTVQSRVLVYLVSLAAAAIAMTGVVAYAMQLGETDRTIDDDLRVRTVAFLDLAAGVDPQTGLPWAGAEPLLRAGIGQVTATATESAVGHVNGRATFVSGGDIRLDLASDAEFLAQSDASAQNSVTVQSAKTSQREYRYVSVPIKDETGKTIATFTIATDRGEIVHELNESFGGFAIAGVIALSILAAVAWVTVGRLLRPIRLLDSTAREISESDLRSRIPIVGNDDLARLSVTVNDMLDRVEAGYEAQRQLLDDAGHELRTPLAVMRTNLELLEPRDPGQVEDSQKLLLDEISMMARLVDDLVVLAKADRPEFVTHERVDVADLTNAAFARAQALGDRTWVLEQTADGVIRRATSSGSFRPGCSWSRTRSSTQRTAPRSGSAQASRTARCASGCATRHRGSPKRITPA